jgi:aquaporin Z
VFAGGWALAQLWLFWVAPIVGAVWRVHLPVYRSGRIKEQNADLRIDGSADFM